MSKEKLLKKINDVLKRTKEEGTSEYKLYQALKVLQQLHFQEQEEKLVGIHTTFSLDDDDGDIVEGIHYLIMEFTYGRSGEIFICLEDCWGHPSYLLEEDGEWRFEEASSEDA